MPGRMTGRPWQMACLSATLVVLSVVSAGAEQVTGSIETRVRQGATRAVPVVYAERADVATPARPGTFTITQKGKSFAPRVLAVPVGSSVGFPNEDPIFHNVFSMSTPQPFDLGLYRAGATKARTFSEPAAYYVFCNIHPQMVAFLVVAPSAWVTTAAPDGSWRLDVPPGRYRITALSERAAPVSVDVTVGSTSAVAPPLILDESGAVTTPHLNKFGKAYPKSAYVDR